MFILLYKHFLTILLLYNSSCFFIIQELRYSFFTNSSFTLVFYSYNIFGNSDLSFPIITHTSHPTELNEPNWTELVNLTGDLVNLWIAIEVLVDWLRSWGEELLADACRLLEEEVELSDSAHGGKVEYRKTLTTSFFFKFYMQVLQELRERVHIQDRHNP